MFNCLQRLARFPTRSPSKGPYEERVWTGKWGWSKEGAMKDQDVQDVTTPYSGQTGDSFV